MIWDFVVKKWVGPHDWKALENRCITQGERVEVFRKLLLRSVVFHVWEVKPFCVLSVIKHSVVFIYISVLLRTSLVAIEDLNIGDIFAKQVVGERFIIEF